MAGVEAIRFGTLPSDSLSSVQSIASASANNNQFDAFLQDSKASVSDSKVADSQVDKGQSDVVVERDNSCVKQEKAMVGAEEPSGKEDAFQDMETYTEAVAAVEGSVRQALKEELSITDDEINRLLEQMGIALTDLFNPQILQQFVLQMHGGEENLDFLMNEDLMSEFSNLMQVLESLYSDDVQFLLSMTDQAPMTLEEFLAQAGISEEEVSIVQVQGFPETVLQNDTGGLEGAAPNAVIAGESAEETIDMSMVEKITVHTEKDSKETPEMGAMFENETETSSEGEESLQGEPMQQDSSDFLFSQQTEREGTVTQMFNDQLHTAQGDVTRLFSDNISGSQRMQQMIDIVNQVSSSIRNTMNADTTTMQLQLNPESLGKVFISVVSKEGIMTATFHVQTDEAKNALESQMYTLRENLESKNLKVESVEVQVSDFDFAQSSEAEGQGQSDSAQKGKRQFQYDSEISDETEASREESEQQVREQVMRDTGGSIDFTA